MSEKKINFRKAQKQDINSLKTFYDEIIDWQKDDPYSPEWKKDIYPNLDDIVSHIEENGMYLMEEENTIIRAAAVVLNEDPIYREGNWKLKTDDDQVAVIHLLAINKKYRRKGYSSLLLQNLIRVIKEEGKKAIHLDTMINNIPAGKLYINNGFVYRGLLNVYYPDTGNMKVKLFEYDY